jgi:osmoprotectant transport system substrate-binding protein
MRKYWRSVTALVAVLVVAALLLSACGSTSGSSSGSTSAKNVKKGPIVIGSKLDGEGVLLAQIMMQVLQAHGFTVVDKTRTGATKVVRQALLSKQIDAYPEYTANALLVFHNNIRVSPSVLQSATLTYEKAKAEDAAIGITWLYEAPANNTWAVAVPQAFAKANKLVSLEDLAKYINGGGKFKIAGSQEFFTSDVAFPAFEKAYGFALKPSQEVQVGTGDTALPEKTAAQGTDGVNATMAYGTDGTLSALGLVVLTDPKGAQPFYQPAPIFRTAVINKYPDIKVWLSPVFVRLDLATLQSLNKQVSVDGRDPKVVAADWLKSSGFIK